MINLNSLMGTSLDGLTDTNIIKNESDVEKFKELFLNIQENTTIDTEKENEKLKEACQEFETYFIKQLFKSMKSTINKENLIGYSKAEETFTDMLDDEYSKKITEAGGIGLANMLYKQMKRENG